MQSEINKHPCPQCGTTSDVCLNANALEGEIERAGEQIGGFVTSRSDLLLMADQYEEVILPGCKYPKQLESAIESATNKVCV